MESSRDDFVIAIRSAFLKKGTQQRFSLLGLIFFSIILLVLDGLNFKPIKYAKTAIKEVVYRTSFIVSGPENFIKNNYLIIKNHLNLYQENQKNITELNSLKRKDLSNQIITLENIKYKSLIDDYYIKGNETVAKVLNDKQSPFLRSIIINKGSKNNIKLGMIVLDEGYLVGKVVEINYFTSRVLLISDINSKIPVSLQPGGFQAIMSGKGEETGILQYIKDKDLKNSVEEFMVLTSGAGSLFKSGIPIGKIKNDKKISGNKDKIVEFYKNFSQLKYVKVVSFLKEESFLDRKLKKNSSKVDIQIEETNQEQETLRILLEQKKIADEIRVKIEEENSGLKNHNIILQNKLVKIKKNNQQDAIQTKEIKFLKLNLLYGPKCRKTIFNNLYKVNTKKYRICILNKGNNKN